MLIFSLYLAALKTLFLSGSSCLKLACKILHYILTFGKNSISKNSPDLGTLVLTGWPNYFTFITLFHATYQHSFSIVFISTHIKWLFHGRMPEESERDQRKACLGQRNEARCNETLDWGIKNPKSPKHWAKEEVRPGKPELHASSCRQTGRLQQAGGFLTV